MTIEISCAANCVTNPDNEGCFLCEKKKQKQKNSKDSTTHRTYT